MNVRKGAQIVEDGVVMEYTDHGWAGVLPGIDAEISRALGRERAQDEESEAA